MRKNAPLQALLLATLLLAVSCGARLTEEQRLAGVGSVRGAPGDSAGPGDDGGFTDDGGIGDGGTDPNTGLPTSGPGVDPTGGPLPTLPTGGNGGATDTGVTGNQIVIATASDVQGVQPGLFRSTWQAMTALTAMVNAQGGIYGRALKPLLLDSRANAVDDRAAANEACEKAFAMVGSMSAFDNGGAAPGQACGIPDIRSITVNAARAKATNVYPVYPIRPDKLMLGPGAYIKQKHPDVITKAAFLWLNADVTRSNAQQRIKGYTERLGYKFIYTAETQVVTPNWGPYANKIKERQIQYVSMVSDYQSIVGLIKALRKINYVPKVMDWDSVGYSPGFVSKDNAIATEGSMIFLNTALLEESAANAEMRLYTQWLARVAPGVKPDYFGLYAWSAGRLFVKTATAIGPKLTRKALFEALKSTHSWNGNGLHAAHDIGNKQFSPCFLYVQVQSGKFVRKDPASGWICDLGGIADT